MKPLEDIHGVIAGENSEATHGAAAAETKMQSQHHLPLGSGSRAMVSDPSGWELERALMRKQITDLERIKHDLEGRLFGALKTDPTLRSALHEIDHSIDLSRGLYSMVLDIACVHVARVKELEAAALGNRTPARQEERPNEKGVGAAPLPVQGQGPWDEALHGYTMLGSTKAYCCYGMYADVGHSSDCKHAKQKGPQ